MSKKKPQKEDGVDLLMRALVAGSADNAILSQEADGQQSFVGSDTLPTDMRRDTKAALEAAGVKFLGVVEGDSMFQYVELPKGWQKVPTDHSMHSNLVDDKGRKRAGIFYKAASYDRSANLGVNRRYGTSIDYDKLEEGVAIANVTDGNDVIHTTESVKFDDRSHSYDAQDEARNLARAWLDEHYPDWNNAAAYWD